MKLFSVFTKRVTHSCLFVFPSFKYKHVNQNFSKKKLKIIENKWILWFLVLLSLLVVLVVSRVQVIIFIRVNMFLWTTWKHLVHFGQKKIYTHTHWWWLGFICMSVVPWNYTKSFCERKEKKKKDRLKFDTWIFAFLFIWSKHTHTIISHHRYWVLFAFVFGWWWWWW